MRKAVRNLGVSTITAVIAFALIFFSRPAQALDPLTQCQQACEDAFDNGEIDITQYHQCIAACDGLTTIEIIGSIEAIIKGILDTIKKGGDVAQQVIGSVNWGAVVVVVGGTAVVGGLLYAACALSGACLPVLALVALAALLLMPLDANAGTGGGGPKGPTCEPGCVTCAAGECCDTHSVYTMSSECMCASGYKMFCK